MQTNKRQREIFELAESQNMVRISTLARKYNVSVETIRRDINALAEKGMLKKVHGGAVFIKNQFDDESEFNIRINEFAAEKSMISKLAAGFIKSGDVIAIDCGVTMISLANALNDLEDITVLTNSLYVAQIICEKIQKKTIAGKVFILGGRLEPSEFSVTGTQGLLQLLPCRFDKFFTSVTSITSSGFYLKNAEVANITKQYIQNSTQTIILSNSQKFTNASYYKCASFNDVDLLIVDKTDNINESTMNAINNSTCQMIIAGRQP